MGRAGGRKPLVKKLQRKLHVPKDPVASAEIELEAKRLYEELKRNRDDRDDSDLDEITETELSSSTSGDSSSSPEPVSESPSVTSSTNNRKQPRRRTSSQRRRQWREPPRIPGSSRNLNLFSGINSPLRNMRQQVQHHLNGCSGLHKHLSCKDMEKLQQLSDHLLSVRQAIYMALRFSVPIQVLIVGHFHRTIPQLKSIEEAMYIADRFLRWMVSQPGIVLQLARRLCCCNNDKSTSCHFDAFGSDSDTD